MGILRSLGKFSKVIQTQDAGITLPNSPKPLVYFINMVKLIYLLNSKYDTIHQLVLC